MITINRLRNRAGFALHKWQARRLLARINRRQAMAERPANPGYDELRCPYFLGTMALAVIVLLVDELDGWASVETMLAGLVAAIGA